MYRTTGSAISKYSRRLILLSGGYYINIVTDDTNVMHVKNVTSVTNLCNGHRAFGQKILPRDVRRHAAGLKEKMKIV